MIEVEAAKILKEDSCWECSYGTIYGATQCGNTQCNVARATNLAVAALEQLALYKKGGLCLVPAELYEKQCKELDELKEKQTAKKPVPRLVLGELFSYCPVCEMVLNHGQSHCDRCGQHIYWSKEET